MAPIMVETASLGEGMGISNINEASEIRKILESACTIRELVILVTPYMRFESNILALDGEAIHTRITMSAEEATYGMRSPDLRLRFPYMARFLEGRTRLLGFGALGGRRTLRLAIPKVLQDDEHRRAYRVERVGKVPVTFSTPRFDLKSGMLVNISTMGARIISPQEPLETLLKRGDSIAVSIPLTEGVLIQNSGAVVHWSQGKTIGVEFRPPLNPDVLAPLARWIFQRREEDKERVGTSFLETAPSGKKAPGMVLVSFSQELEDGLRDLFAGLPPLKRVPATAQAIKEALTESPSLVFFHLSDAGLDSRRRLKTLVEVLAGKVPFVLLGTQVENSQLFDLGGEHKAAAVYDLGSKPGPFLLRLVQGILRRHQGEA